MYAVCDGTMDLSNLVWFNSSQLEALSLFLRLNPKSTSLLLFRDLRCQRRMSDLIFVDKYSAAKIRSLINKKNK